MLVSILLLAGEPFVFFCFLLLFCFGGKAFRFPIFCVSLLWGLLPSYIRATSALSSSKRFTAQTADQQPHKSSKRNCCVTLPTRARQRKPADVVDESRHFRRASFIYMLVHSSPCSRIERKTWKNVPFLSKKIVVFFCTRRLSWDPRIIRLFFANVDVFCPLLSRFFFLFSCCPLL